MVLHVWSDLSQIFVCFKKKTYQVKFLVAALQCLCECTQWAAWKWLVLKNIWTIFDLNWCIFHKRVQVFHYYILYTHVHPFQVRSDSDKVVKQEMNLQSSKWWKDFSANTQKFPFIEIKEIAKSNLKTSGSNSSIMSVWCW